VLEKRLSEARTGEAAAADAAKRAYADLTKTCKTCHDSYRNK
jgi:cytochrome c556